MAKKRKAHFLITDKGPAGEKIIAARLSALCNRAAELGLQMCPVEVGPGLRLQYIK